MHPDIRQYHAALDAAHQELCARLAKELDAGLAGAESKIWHGHPVWFLEGNPIVGFSKQKPGIRLMFWSGADFEEPGLNVLGRKFKDAAEFKKLLCADIDKFNAAFIEKLATYALRRTMTIDDRDELAKIAATSKANDYRLQSVIEALVLSEIFQKR